MTPTLFMAINPTVEHLYATGVLEKDINKQNRSFNMLATYLESLDVTEVEYDAALLQYVDENW